MAPRECALPAGWNMAWVVVGALVLLALGFLVGSRGAERAAELGASLARGEERATRLAQELLDGPRRPARGAPARREGEGDARPEPRRAPGAARAALRQAAAVRGEGGQGLRPGEPRPGVAPAVAEADAGDAVEAPRGRREPGPA